MALMLGKTIIATHTDDKRFLVGEGVEDAFSSPYDIGKSMKLVFNDGTYLELTPMQSPEGDLLVRSWLGTWVDDNGTIRETS